MKQIKLEWYKEVCKHASVLTGSSISLYKERERIYCSKQSQATQNFDLSNFYFNELFSESTPISYRIVNNALLYALIRSKDESFSFLLGPICVCSLTPQEIQSTALFCGIKKEDFKDFSNYVSYLPVLQFNYAMQILSFFYLIINRSTYNPTNFVIQENNTPDYLFEKIFDVNENLQYDEVERHTSYEFENKMLFYIQAGQTENLIKLFQEVPIGRTGKLATSPLRQEQNNLICAITLATRSAISGGLNREIALHLSDITIQKVEFCKSIKECYQLNYNFMVELAEKVAALQCNSNQSPLIRRVVEYLGERICERITIESIAQKFHTNRSFLSTKFKAEMNISLNEYINKQKVIESKKLLSYTDKSLAEISNYLSFSSQSHFQNTFKKFTGVTPTHYRKTKS